MNQNMGMPQPNWNGGANSWLGSVNQQNLMNQNQIMGQQNTTINPAQMQNMNNASQMLNVVPGLQGRVINTPQEIVPGEIPMNGTRSVFPAYDGSRIYVKYWDNNAQLQTDIYILEQQIQPQQANYNGLDEILNRLSNIESMLTIKQRYNKPYHKPKKNNGKDDGNNGQ